jgi:hypothetical protein
VTTEDFELQVIILTKGERSQIFSKIFFLQSFFKESKIKASISISLNLDPLNPPLPSLKNQLVQMNIKVIDHKEFIDSVEEHMLACYKMASEYNPSAWVWLMDDSDLYDPVEFEAFLPTLTNSSLGLVFLNNRYLTQFGKKSDPRVFALNEKADLSLILLNSGITQAPSKLGAWIIRRNLITDSAIETWETWNRTTILWTHGYFFLLIALNNPTRTLFYNECVIDAIPNPTDTDRHANWLNWYKRKNKIFQQDWTFGQLYLLNYFLKQGILSIKQVKHMTVSCSQRGVMPLTTDILFRIIVNQLPSAVFTKEARMSPEDVVEFFGFLEILLPEESELLNSAKVVLSKEPVSNFERLICYKRALFLFNEHRLNPWLTFKRASTPTHNIYERQTGFFSLEKTIDPILLFRDASEWQFANSKSRFDLDLKVLMTESELDVEAYISEPREFNIWIDQQFRPDMRMPRLQILIIRFGLSENFFIRRYGTLVYRLVKRFL